MSERKLTTHDGSLCLFLIVVRVCDDSFILNILRESSLDNKHGTNNFKNFV